MPLFSFKLNDSKTVTMSVNIGFVRTPIIYVQIGNVKTGNSDYWRTRIVRDNYINDIREAYGVLKVFLVHTVLRWINAARPQFE